MALGQASFPPAEEPRWLGERPGLGAEAALAPPPSLVMSPAVTHPELPDSLSGPYPQNWERSQRERDQEKLNGIPEGLVMSPLRGDCRPFGPAHCYDLGLPALPLYKAREITQEVRSKDTTKEHTGRGL